MTALKKPLCGILAFALTFVLIAATPISVFAEDEETTYSAQEIELNKKTDEEGFEYVKVDQGSAVEIVGYTGTETEVKVPSKIGGLSVISIGNGAFAGNDKIVSVKLNNNVTSMGDEVFKNCTALTEVDSIKALESIGASCFEGCTALVEFKIPDNVTSVAEKCFYGCSALAEVDVHKNLKSVAKDAFVGTAWENAMPDGPLSLGRVLYSYKGALKDVVIPKGVSLIEDYAFIGCDSMETLTLGYDVEEIGLYAFQNCVNLKSVNVNDALGVVSAGAFKGCVSLTSMDFSESTLATIGYEAFSDCVALNEVKLCETISEIGDYAFQGTSLKTISFDKNVNSVGVNSFLNVKTFESFDVVSNNKEFSAVDGVLFNKKGTTLVCFPAAKAAGEKYELPEGVSEIRAKAFYGSKVAEVVIPENTQLERIGVSVFENSAIKAFAIPANVHTIETATFKNAQNLAKVTLAEGVNYIGTESFYGCKALTEIALPASVEEIANKAFANAGLKSVDTGDGLAKIATEAFIGNKALTDVKLGKNVEKLGDKVFAGCTALKQVNLPVSMKNISANAFDNCKALAKVTVDGENKNFKAVNGAIYSADGKVLVMVANAKSVAVADGTEVIAEGAFNLVADAAAISFPSTLKSVEGNALDATAWYKVQTGVVYAGPVLYKVKGDVAEVIVTDGVTAIADNAISNASVKKVVLPETLKVIGKNAFEKSGITSIVIPNSVESIGVCAFLGAKNLVKVTLSSAIDEIKASTFKACVKLASIVIPENVKVISADAFAGCKSLAEVDLGSVEEIEQYAFSKCAALKEITLPATIETVDAVSFYGCTALAKIDVAEGNAKFKSLDGVVLVANEGEDPVFETIAIYPVGKSGEYKVPAEIKNIADKAFYNCDAITSIVFEEGFGNIGAEAFYDCDNIKTISMPESARDINDYAFASCDNLREFVVYSNLTDYADNAFDGCNYINYDAVTINVEDNSAATLAIVAGVLVVIGVIGLLVYNKKQKKLQQEIIEKNKIKEALEAQNK